MAKVDVEAAAIILINGKKVLMQHRDSKPNIDCPDYWGIPGGVVEKGESPNKAAQRELAEEAGYRSDSHKFLIKDIYKSPNGRKVKRHLFYGKYDQKQKIKCFEGKEMKFISPREFKNMKICPGHAEFIKLALKKTKDLI